MFAALAEEETLPEIHEEESIKWHQGARSFYTLSVWRVFMSRLEVLDLVRGEVLAARPKAAARGDPGALDFSLPRDTLPGALALMTEASALQPATHATPLRNAA